MPVFETIKTNAGTQPKNELQQWALVRQLLLWCLLRNFEETAAKPPLPPKTAISRRIFCCWHFSLNYTFLNHLSPTYFFQKIILTFALNTCDFFGWIVKYLKYYKCQMKNVRVIFLKKNKLGSNDSEMYNSARNGKKKIWRLMAVFGGSGGFAAVSSQFQNKHRKSNCHTKAHCCNSFFGWVPALVLMVSKSGTSAPPPFKNKSNNSFKKANTKKFASSLLLFFLL